MQPESTEREGGIAKRRRETIASLWSRQQGIAEPSSTYSPLRKADSSSQAQLGFPPWAAPGVLIFSMISFLLLLQMKKYIFCFV